MSSILYQGKDRIGTPGWGMGRLLHESQKQILITSRGRNVVVEGLELDLAHGHAQ